MAAASRSAVSAGKGIGVTWLSPVGWAELIRSFGQIRWWILALPLMTTLVLAAAAGVLAARRDYDAGLLADRPGPAQAAGWLRSALALACRLHHAMLIAWVIVALRYGAVVGETAKGIGGLLGSSEISKIMIKLGGQAAFINAYRAAITSFSGLIAAGSAVSAVLRLRSEETSGRAEPVLATATARISWGLSHLSIAAGGTVPILAATGLVRAWATPCGRLAVAAR